MSTTSPTGTPSTTTGPPTTGAPATGAPSAGSPVPQGPGAPPPTTPSARSVHPAGRGRRRDERAEGVISTAIAVLIVAFLGIGLWQGFQLMMDSATERTQQQVEQIGG